MDVHDKTHEKTRGLPMRGTASATGSVIAVLVAALVAAGCTASSGNDAAAAAADQEVGTLRAPDPVEDADLPTSMVSRGELASITGIASLSQPRLKQGEDGPLPPICGERTGAAAPFRWSDYKVVPVDDDRQPYAENVAVAVLEFESDTAAGEAFTSIADGFSSCTEYTHRTLALSRVDMSALDLGDEAFLFVARATQTDEFLHGTTDRQLERAAVACEIRIRDGSSVSAVGVFVSEERLDDGACEAVAQAAADRLAA